MSASILLAGKVATFDGEKWKYYDRSTEDLLNTITPEFSGDDPNPDRTAAEYIVKNYGGKILNVDDPEYTPGRVY